MHLPSEMCKVTLQGHSTCSILFPEIGACQHLLGALHREFADIPTHNMRNFTYALFGTQFIYNGDGAVIEYLLIDIVVRVGKGGNLWQVCYTDDLVIAGKLPQLFSHDLSAASADTGVNLVED